MTFKKNQKCQKRMCALRSIPTVRLQLRSRNFPLMFHVARCEWLHGRHINKIRCSCHQCVWMSLIFICQNSYNSSLNELMSSCSFLLSKKEIVRFINLFSLSHVITLLVKPEVLPWKPHSCVQYCKCHMQVVVLFVYE